MRKNNFPSSKSHKFVCKEHSQIFVVGCHRCPLTIDEMHDIHLMLIHLKQMQHRFHIFEFLLFADNVIFRMYCASKVILVTLTIQRRYGIQIQNHFQRQCVIGHCGSRLKCEAVEKFGVLNNGALLTRRAHLLPGDFRKVFASPIHHKFILRTTTQ